MKSRHITRDRYLTPEEGERYRKIREQEEREKPEMIAQFKRQGDMGHLTHEDAVEILQFQEFLRDERKRQQLDLVDVSKRCGVPSDKLEDFEDARDSNPSLELLTRYARALGLRLMLALRPAGVSEEPQREQDLAVR